MESILSAYSWVVAHADSIAAVVGGAMAVALAAVKLTPTQRDDEIVAKASPWVGKLLSWLTRNSAQKSADKAGQ